MERTTMTGSTNILILLALNLIMTYTIVKFIYYPTQRNKEFVFTFFGFNAITFLVSSMLFNTDMSIGFGFSLFAIFSILRYRTDPIPIREMTYMFVIMALPVVNAVMIGESQWLTCLCANLTLLLVLFAVEKEWGFKFEAKQTINYEKINLITPENRAELLLDLQHRTGLPIKRIEIGKIDFLRDTAEIKVYYDPTQAEKLTLSRHTTSSADGKNQFVPLIMTKR